MTKFNIITMKLLYDQHKSYRKVAKLMNCSKSLVHKALTKKTEIVEKKKRGPKEKLTDRDKRKIKNYMNRNVVFILKNAYNELNLNITYQLLEIIKKKDLMKIS